MKYMCINVYEGQTWFTVERIYDAEDVISPKELSGGKYILVKKADDNYLAYAPKTQFALIKDELNV